MTIGSSVTSFHGLARVARDGNRTLSPEGAGLVPDQPSSEEKNG